MQHNFADGTRQIRRGCFTIIRFLFLLVGLAANGFAWAATADVVLGQQNVSSGSSFLLAGARATITMQVANNGPDTAEGVVLTDTLPPGATFVSMTFPGGTCTPSGGTYRCVLGDMAYDPSGGIEVTLVLDFPTPGVQVNHAELKTATSDLNSNNDSSTSSITVVSAANLNLVANSVASGETFAGAAIDYTLKVSNSGSSAVTAGQQSTVSFEVPAGASITEVPRGSGWTCTPTASSYPITNPPSTNTIISCTRSDGLAMGASFPEITVPAVGNVNGSITANFGVMTSAEERNTRDNTATVNVTLVDGSDMSINKTVRPSGKPVLPGSQVKFTLQAERNGGTAPTDVRVTDTLPAGLTYVASTFSPPPPWDCSWTEQTLTCLYPGQYTGGNFTLLPAIQFDAIVDPSFSGSLTNEGVVSAKQYDPDNSNNSSQVTIGTSGTADQLITKTSTVASPILVGKEYSFNLVARNIGPIDVQKGQLITVNDTIPEGMSLRAIPRGTGWVCDLSPAATGNEIYPLAGPVTVACTRTDGISTPSNWNTISVPVVNTKAGSTANTACVHLTSVGSEPTDTNAANDCSTATLAVKDTNTQQADLSINKTASSASTLAGDRLSYTISVTNQGPDDATDVVITDYVTDLSYVANSLNNVKGTAPQGGVTCTPVSGRYMNQNVTCTVPLLKNGETATITLDVIPSGASATTKTRPNKATVTSLSVKDPHENNNTITISTTVEPRFDLTASKTVAPSSVRVGEPLSFVIGSKNNGPSIASNVKLSDEMPANTSFLELTAANGGSCTVPAVGATSGTIECTWPTVLVNAQQTASYKLLPTKDAVNTTISNTVVTSAIQADGTTKESNTNNNTAQASAAVTAAELDILVQKTDSVDPVALGEMTQYTITISNAGPSTGTNLVMTDTFPNSKTTARFSYQGGLTTSETPISCKEPSVGATSGTLTCTFSSISKGKNIVVTYMMKAESIAVEGAYSGTQGNDVNVKVDETETGMANNSATEETTTRRSSVPTDLALKKAIDKSTIKAGETATYTLTVTNNGPTDSSGAQIIDTLPAGMTFQSSPDGCVDNAGVVTCAVGTLNNGANKAFHVVVTLASPYTGTSPIVNSATVDAPGDPNSSNNTDSTSTTVTPDASGGPESIPTMSNIALLMMLLLLAASGGAYLYRRR